ncbi:serine/threonine-protein kinase [Nonomuraea endophytica]|uniref:Serine/threonine protein kinase/ABC-type amino acid transport substrate-binding protein n=1 Tax=Nonomuraea endophytica TaxID=714136 RepID=A0A7W8EC05_9ACTN|nr:serine/threonine-protein kinase [Nonomuraea endophytica]MBB5074935.1 serine/threonine protein kinase/ABC-type amino acid transport substrate-binding protein [Nonomuraea endophytica]
MPQIAPLVAGDPEQLGSFQLTGRVGEGGQGIVYLGVNEQGERAAIKLLHIKFSGDTIARSRFARELKAAERVASFCTARVLEADLDGNTPYIASEYIDGLPLREVVDNDGPMRGTALDRLAIGTATALTAIHHASIVHRDFKPDNVLIAADGPRVVDFGIARIIDSTGTITSRAIGTPAYMAPEQIAGDDVGPFTDVFSWGATIAFAATGVTVFEGSSIAVVLNRILNHEVDVSAMPEPLRGVVASALAKDPQARPTADQLLLRLLGQPETAGASTAVLSRGAEVASDDTTPFTRVRTTLADARKPAEPGESGMPAPPSHTGHPTQPPPAVPEQAPTSLSERPPMRPAPQGRRGGPGRWIAVVVALVVLAAAAVLAVLNDWPVAFGAQPPSESVNGGNTPPQPGPFTSVMDKIAKTGKLTVGVKGDLPGISLSQGGSFQGFDVDLAGLIAKALGAKDVKYVQVGRFDRATALSTGKVDLVVATYSIDRDEEVLFAGPYYVAHHDVLVRAGTAKKLADLKGMNLCAPPSPSTRSVQDRVEVTPIPAAHYAECMDMLKSGKVDAVPGEDLLLAGFADREVSMRFAVLGARLSSQRYAVGMERGDARTCKAVSGVIAGLQRDGTIKKLVSRHFGNVDFKPQLNPTEMEPCG